MSSESWGQSPWLAELLCSVGRLSRRAERGFHETPRTRALGHQNFQLKVAARKYFHESFLTGKIEDVIERLQMLQRDYPESTIECESDGYTYEFNLIWLRDETDEEYAKRKAAEIEEANENRLKMERKIAKLQAEAASFGIRVTMEK